MISVKNKTNIFMLLDRSGSMAQIAKDVRESIKSFLEEQKRQDGECYITLVQFDSIDPQEVIFKEVDIKNVRYDPDTFSPRSMTPLWDALGMLLSSSKFNDNDKNIIVVISDGAENCSKEFTSKQVRNLVADKEKNGFVFVYLGANVDVFKEGSQIGFAANTTVSYNFSGEGIKSALSVTSNKISKYRAHVGIGGQSLMNYDDEDRDYMSGINK